MSTLDFPNHPNVGDEWVGSNAATYEWDGSVWVLTSPAPEGAAGGDLVGFYPNPTIAAGVVSLTKLAPAVAHVLPPTPAMPADSGKALTVSASTGLPIWTTPAGGGGGATGPASGDLTGTYPNPSLSVIQSSKVQLAGRGAFYSGPGGASVAVNDGAHDASYVPTSVSWAINMLDGLGSDETNISHRLANAASGAYTKLLTVNADGTIRATTDPVNALDLATRQYVLAHAGTSYWSEDVTNNALVPTNLADGIAIQASGDDIVLRHSNFPTVQRRTGMSADDNLLSINAASSGMILKTQDSATVLSYLTGGGLWRFGDGTTPTERLELATGGIQVGAALAAKDGTIQYAAGHLQGRVSGSWVQLDNAPAGSSDGSLGTQAIYTTNTVLTTANQDSLINANVADVQLTLPAFSTALAGKVFRITRVDGQAARQATIMPAGADNIDGINAFITLAPNESITLMACGTVANGRQWVRVADPTWRTIQTGNILTPGDANKVLVSQAAGNALQWGARVAKGYLGAGLVGDASSSAYWSLNCPAPFNLGTNSTAEPSWLVRLQGTSDNFTILRAPATSNPSPVFANLLALDNAGRATFAGSVAVGPAVASPPDGTVQYASGHFQGRVSGGWVQLDMSGVEVATNKWKPVWPIGVAGAAQTLTTGQLMVQRVRVASPIQALAFEVSSAAAGGLIQLGVYDDSAYPNAGVLKQSSANIACDAAGYKTFTFSPVLPPGVYWFAVQNTGSVAVPGRTLSPQNPYHPGAATLVGTGSSANSSLLINGQGASMPSPCPAGSDYVSIGMQIEGA